MTPRDDALCKTVLDESARFRDMMAQSRSRADGIFKLRDTIELFVSKCAPPPPPPPPLGAPKIMPLLALPAAAPDDNTLCATMLAEFARLRDVAVMTSVLPLNEKALAHDGRLLVDESGEHYDVANLQQLGRRGPRRRGLCQRHRGRAAADGHVAHVRPHRRAHGHVGLAVRHRSRAASRCTAGCG